MPLELRGNEARESSHVHRFGEAPNRAALEDAGFRLRRVIAGAGVIGTNKPDAAETVDTMLRDLDAGVLPTPTDHDPASVDAFIRLKQPHCITYEAWQRLDAEEVARGQKLDRPRVKFTSVDEMIAFLR